MLLPVFYIVMLLCYGVLLHQYYTAAKNGAYSLAHALYHKRDLKHFNRRHAVGLLAMLVATVCYYRLPLTNYQWLLPRMNDTAALPTLVLGVIALAASYYFGFRALHIKDAAYTYRQADRYLLLRFLFLIVYELFFRVVLLASAMAFTPVWVAVVVNIFLYMLVHRFSARREQWGAVPFSLLLCWLTLVHQSFWPALLLHLLLAMPYEVILISKNKNCLQTYGS